MFMMSLIETSWVPIIVSEEPTSDQILRFVSLNINKYTNRNRNIGKTNLYVRLSVAMDTGKTKAGKAKMHSDIERF